MHIHFYMQRHKNVQKLSKRNKPNMHAHTQTHTSQFTEIKTKKVSRTCLYLVTKSKEIYTNEPEYSQY